MASSPEELIVVTVWMIAAVAFMLGVPVLVIRYVVRRINERDDPRHFERPSGPP